MDALLYRKAAASSAFVQELRVAADGLAAVELLGPDGLSAGKDRPFRPDLIVTDLQMPRMSGMKLLEWLGQRPAYAATPKVVCSCSPRPAEIQTAHLLGASAYIVKPTSSVEMRRVLSCLFEFWAHCEVVPKTRPPG